MGTCISKCRPKKTSSQKDFYLIEDKLVISQPPSIIPLTLLPNKQSLSPCSSPSSSSFSCTTSASIITSCSSSTPSSSYSSSVLTPKDNSFSSNELLWSCIKENPPLIIPVKPTNSTPVKSLPLKVPPRIIQSPSKSVLSPAKKQPVPVRRTGSQPQKRIRDCSPPTLTRQKSFRKEPERPNSTIPIPKPKFNSPSSPSQSRRFNGDLGKVVLKNPPKESCKIEMGLKNNGLSEHKATRKENLRPRSPVNSLMSRDGNRSRETETCTHHIHAKPDQNTIGELFFNQGINSPAMDDIDNPHISLDCFIFL